MGKKIALGCSITAIIIIAVIGSLLYFYIYVPAKDYMDEFVQLEEVKSLNEQIDNRTQYSPPVDGKMTSEQLEKYLQVQRIIHEGLGATFHDLEKKYENIQAATDDRGRQPGFREALDLWTDVIGIIVEAKRAQVAGLNRAGLSLNEYHWIRKQVLGALGYGAFGLDLEEMVGDPTAIVMQSLESAPPDMEILEHNRKLVEAQKAEIEKWVVISYFGL